MIVEPILLSIFDEWSKSRFTCTRKLARSNTWCTQKKGAGFARRRNASKLAHLRLPTQGVAHTRPNACAGVRTRAHFSARTRARNSREKSLYARSAAEVSAKVVVVVAVKLIVGEGAAEVVGEGR